MNTSEKKELDELRKECLPIYLQSLQIEADKLNEKIQKIKAEIDDEKGRI